MKSILAHTILILFFSFISASTLFSQDFDADHKLLWKISSPSSSQPSYVYGTMHLRDERVFNFSDSLYLKIEDCKYFALEVHPDSMSKSLIIDPFNSAIDNSIEEEFELDALNEYETEIKDKTGVDLSGFSKQNMDLIPLLLDKMFKKGKDKNTFLDAHLYHIAKVLEKRIVGLESLEDHRLALRSFAVGEKTDLPQLFDRRKAQMKIFEEMIDIYSKGNAQELFDRGGFKHDSILAYRNNVMVNNSIQYIDDGGIFMAVGAAHLHGEEGIIKLLQNKGFKVEAVKAKFSKKIVNAELATRELEWIEEIYPKEGFSISIPDHAYNYRPESAGGVMTIRSYPDLGLGHFFFYTVTPIMVESFSLESIKEELLTNMESKGATYRKRDIKNSSYDGGPSLDMKFQLFGSTMRFRYIIKNNHFYVLGVMPTSAGDIDKTLVKKFFNSLKFRTIEKGTNSNYIDEKGAFNAKSNIVPQTYNLLDDTEGINTITEYFNFFDQEARLLHMVTYTYNEANSVYDNTELILGSYEQNFITDADSLLYVTESAKFGGKEFHIEFTDGSFLKALIFVRGNRIYQIANTGAISDKNYENSEKFIADFELIDYQEPSFVAYENNDFYSKFFSNPTIDTISEQYLLRSSVTKSITYSSLDLASGMNFIINEQHLSPYATYEQIDTCFKRMKENYVAYNDSVIYYRNNNLLEALEFELQTVNPDNQLDYQYRIILDNDRLYEIFLIQDTAALNEVAAEDILRSFKLKGKREGSILLRDSTSVRKLVKEDIFSSDTIVKAVASKVISSFGFTSAEIDEIFTKYTQADLSRSPIQYHENMVDFLADKKMEELKPILEKLYNSDEANRDLRIKILRELIRGEKSEDILFAKKMLQSHIPAFKDDYKLNSIFYSVYDNLACIKPLFPELLDLGTTDTSIKMAPLFSSLLDEGIIDYSTLEPIHELLDSLNQKKYQLVKNDKNEEDWELKYDLVSLAGLSSYSEAKEETTEIFTYLFQDSSSYFKLKGAEYLLRQDTPIDVSGLYDQFPSNSSIVEMYELERKFDRIDILPDSMLTMSKYVSVASIAYPQDDIYFEDYKSEIIEQYEDDNSLHYFIKCDYDNSYTEDPNDKETIIIYTVIEKEKGPFSIPTYDNVYTEYSYLSEDTLADKKEELKAYYKEFKN